MSKAISHNRSLESQQTNVWTCTPHGKRETLVFQPLRQAWSGCGTDTASCNTVLRSTQAPLAHLPFPWTPETHKEGSLDRARCGAEKQTRTHCPESQFHCLQPVWSWASYQTCLSLSFHISEMVPYVIQLWGWRKRSKYIQMLCLCLYVRIQSLSPLSQASLLH